MARGGARNRSGPQPDPLSGRSDRRGLSLTSLPAHGYDGPIPDFPLPTRVVWHSWFEDGKKVREDDEACTAQVAEREAELWSWAWRTPQAWAWAQPSESWRLHTNRERCPVRVDQAGHAVVEEWDAARDAERDGL